MKTPEARAQEIKMRRLQIIATQMERRRQFYVDGISTSIEDRVTLDAELAALDLEARVISSAAEMAKVARRQQINSELRAHILAILTERGMTDIINEAQARANAGLIAAKTGAA